MSPISTSFKVGAVVLLAVGAFFVGLTLIGGKSFGRGGTYTVSAVFDDATGLGVRTRVQVAGIVIGTVERVELDEQAALARIYIRIDKKYALHRDASITKRSESILGDFLLDVKPGSMNQPLLKDGDEITNIIRQPGMNELFASMGSITDDIKDVTSALKKVLGSDEGQQNLKTIIEGLAKITKDLEHVIDTSGTKLDDTLSNFRDFSGDLKDITASQQNNIGEILANTRDATAEARDVLKSIQGMVGSPGKGEVNDTVKSIKSNLEKLDKTLANVESVTDKINKGEGTLGHLVNDDTLAKNLDKATTSITNLLGRASAIQLEVSTRTELLAGDLTPKAGSSGLGTPVANNVAYNPWAKNYFSVRLIPRPDKWYGFELIDDPRGNTQLVTIQNCTTAAACTSTAGTSTNPFFPSTLQQITTTRTLKFSVYIAKRYGFISARFGILENTGGFGVKFHLFNDNLVLSSDIFEFANPLKDHPRIKVYADYRFLGHLMITAGVDDAVNAPIEDPSSPSRIISGRDYFIGGGIYFNEDDIKTFLSAIPLLGSL